MKPARQRKKTDAVAKPEVLLTELRELILNVRSQVAQTVNVGLTMLYWKVGNRIRRETLQEQRAEYGQQIVSALGRQLETEFGRGFSEKSLRHMIRFAEAFPDTKIVSSLLRQFEQVFGNCSVERNLRRLIRFTKVYPDGQQIIVSLIRQLSWTDSFLIIKRGTK